jgi:amino acid transporter
MFHDGTIKLIWHVSRHVHDLILVHTQFCAALAWYRDDICHRVRADSAKTEAMTETRQQGHSPTGHAFLIAAPCPSTLASAAPPLAAAAPVGLTTSRGAALYIGALLGPGLLLLPGLAAAEAGPASVLAWAGLLLLSGLFAVVFGALGRGFPSAGGVIGYVRAGLGARAGAIAGWSFLAGVVAGAPVVCLIGAGYVTELTGGGTLARALIAAVLLLSVMALVAGGLRASATAQLLLVSLLLGVIVIAVAGSAHAARAANWTPFAPHGWQAVGHAVYLGCMTSAVRVLRGPPRWAAAPAAVIVAVVLGYCGWALLAALAVILAVCFARPLAMAADAMRERYQSR